MYQDMVDLIKMPVCIYSHNGKKLACNDRWSELLSYLKDWDMMLSHDHQELHSSILSAIKVNRHHELKIPVSLTENRDGEMSFMLLNDQSVLSFLTVKSPSLTVDESVEDVLERMNDAFFSVDHEWRMTYINREAEKFLHCHRTDLIGKNLWKEFPRLRGSEFEENYLRAFHDQVTIQFESYFEPRDHWYQVHVYPNKHGGISIYFRNINELKKMEQSLWQSAHTDYLSALPNRRYAYECMKKYISKDQPFSIFFIDLNQFKIINDLYGHDIGDQLIVKVGLRLQKCMDIDTEVTRLGGDEYLIVVPQDLNDSEIDAVGNQIIGAFNQAFVFENCPDIHVDPSVGVSSFPKDGSLTDTLIDKADIAMYEAKKKQKLRAVRYDPDMHQSISRDLIIQQELKKIVERGELAFVFQPQVDSLNNWITGVEVLARWEHPVLGTVSPAEFIPVAESSGMMDKLTRHQLDTCLHQFAQWKKTYHFDGTIAFNISSLLIRNRSFMRFLEEVIQKHEISYHQVEIEITENIQLFSHRESIQALERLRELGVRVAIDDFGTGYSTLSYLNKFPLDKIKIDKHFTDQIHVDQKGEAILVSIIKLADSLRLDVLAEGVETAEQRDFLQENGCRHMQGYYYFKPMSLKECEKFYREKILKHRV
ncbi:bifunctional diguanylate cyclase/phosphodiesterase [Jeotgalibacillus sp. R-1-5s-1]|uniref:putative bifunctional diguanylate cyclase/phosphodiesterase n=1 Tax=Jeotgalibacillus sp. R-1-5s-1 TaxID=2555897 RepID=UPI00106DB635|nr:GGDEF domain-containing phosphodiesterase [Jeotgalibacillus sp. R-1-5s-1]TFD95780.1 phosphodiesterase [Jeotgalibacillus sp. R-1-5s-1]